MTCRKIKGKDDLGEEGKSNCQVICCGGRAPVNREEAESFVDKFPRWFVPKIVLSLPCKIIIMILFIPYIAAAVYGCIHLKQGMPFTQLVSDDSYFYKYSDWNEKYFSRQNIITFVIPRQYDYSTAETQLMVDDLIASAHSNNYFDNSFEVNWLKSYKDSTYYNGASSLGFYSGLQQFLRDPQNMVFFNDLVIDLNNTDGIILASRVYVRSNSLNNSKEEGEMMLESRTIASAAAIDCFPYSPAFIVAELYVRVLRLTAQCVGIALASVFVITCIFMPHPVLILYVTVAVASIMAGVIGFMYYLDVSLSAISMVMLIMSIGFSVDFTAHICHGYMMSDGETRAVRVRKAIDKTGAPIFHGAVSSIIGILVLTGAKSYIFRSFAAVMSMVLVFGILHALFLLPVILSLIGPEWMNTEDKVKKSEMITMTNSAESDEKGEDL
ncbi:patched domain-containing protein 3-like [Mercenaria mercenaria]|uniref:patched domain-containing protein 3-like n=1 Tax=Mercenaria mercenaria TaxID=6596 RepID=UPI00234F61A4|nr:patched domain-containing protein 3-like [Mercenaria mercenaria]